MTGDSNRVADILAAIEGIADLVERAQNRRMSQTEHKLALSLIAKRVAAARSLIASLAA